jgi:putative membrane protein
LFKRSPCLNKVCTHMTGEVEDLFPVREEDFFQENPSSKESPSGKGFFERQQSGAPGQAGIARTHSGFFERQQQQSETGDNNDEPRAGAKLWDRARTVSLAQVRAKKASGIDRPRAARVESGGQDLSQRNKYKRGRKTIREIKAQKSRTARRQTYIGGGLDELVDMFADGEVADIDNNSGVGAPRQTGDNHDSFRQLFKSEQILLPALILASVAGLECALFTWGFKHFNFHELAASSPTSEKAGDVYFQLEKTPFIVCASLASFMVVFRAQICYNRWWEGRTHVGGINKCLKQLLLLTSATNARSDEDPHNAVRLLFACFACLIQQLWGDDDMEPMRELLSAEEFAQLKGPSVNRPLLIVHWITQPLRDVRGTVYEHDDARRHAIWEEVSQLIGNTNSALKVAYTPIPMSYHIATRFILYAFCFTNPICLAWYHPEFPSMAISVIASAIIAGLFFVISFVSEDLENPFSDSLCLPLDNMLVRYYHEIAQVTPQGWDVYASRATSKANKQMGHSGAQLNVAEHLARAHTAEQKQPKRKGSAGKSDGNMRTSNNLGATGIHKLMRAKTAAPRAPASQPMASNPLTSKAGLVSSMVRQGNDAEQQTFT